MRPLNYLFIAIISISILGCVGNPIQNDKAGAAHYFNLKVNVAYKSSQTRVFIQNGRITGSDFNHSEQHCRIEIKELNDKPQHIWPERFLIKSITIDEEMIAKKQQRILLAYNTSSNVQTDTPYQSNLLAAGGKERPETMDLIHLNLDSHAQPNIMRLTCAGSLSNGNLTDGPESYRPNLIDINKILGGIGTVTTQ